MSRKTRFLALTVGLIAGATAISVPLVARDPAARVQEGRETAQSLEAAFTQLAETVGPSAVSISAVAEVPQMESGLEQLFGPQGLRRPRQAPPRNGGGKERKGDAKEGEDEAPEPLLRPIGGSGVIIRSDGYILTNDHVVEKARGGKVRVKLSSGEVFTGQVFRDDRSDLAVVKIDAKRPLPAIKFADSKRVKVGQWAVAIGSPFGQDNTVTTGIISALQRKSTIGDVRDRRYYPELIQTDAAINPGNSGGPLLNIKGELIGINVGIDTPSGGSVGIGFAIPANTAKYVSEQLIARGKVTRGYLGLTPVDIEPEVRSALKVSQGAYISTISQDSPADKAGLEAGDVVVRFGTTEIRDEVSLRNAIATTEPGTKVPISVLREGKSVELSAQLERLPEPPPPAAPMAPAKTKTDEPLAASLEPLSEEIRSALRLDETLKGVYVAAVRPGTPADEAGLERGMVILSVNGKPVTSEDEAKKAARSVGSGGLLTLRTLLVPREGKPSRGIVNIAVP